ncbi:MAG: glycosyltransferase [Thermodesulfobacteriota bacterium]
MMVIEHSAANHTCLSDSRSNKIRTKSILFVTGCLFNESSGPYHTVQQTAKTLQKRGHQVTVVGTKGPSDKDLDRWVVEARAFQRYGPYSLHYTTGLSRWLKQEHCNWDLASMHGVWMHTNRVVADWCIRHDKPFMVTAHGNFNPTALRVSSWKKWLARMTFMRTLFEHVTCYHALTEVEYQTLRYFGIRQPICVIGNGIEFVKSEIIPEPLSLLPVWVRDRRICLYLGRLHPIKGVDRLLRAWSALRPSDEWLLVIAGSGESDYVSSLEQLLGSGKQNVLFVGFVTGDIKTAWLRAAEFCVLPSYSEAFPVSLLEGFAQSKGALITCACGLPEAVLANAAYEVDSSEEGLKEGLRLMLSLSPGELHKMGERAYVFARDRFNWESISTQLEQVYTWMIGDSNIPSCLRLD